MKPGTGIITIRPILIFSEVQQDSPRGGSELLPKFPALRLSPQGATGWGKLSFWPLFSWQFGSANAPTNFHKRACNGRVAARIFRRPMETRLMLKNSSRKSSAVSSSRGAVLVRYCALQVPVGTSTLSSRDLGLSGCILYPMLTGCFFTSP